MPPSTAPTLPIDDLHARKSALDPKRSFIVQAPAGSGKTELLIQRYLVLLSGVSAPEEIVAITFTRKAASEMRGRVVAALERAESDLPPEADHARVTWELARAAVERDRQHGWNIRENPARLHISTIDALCSSLTRRMPMLSGFGMPPETTDNADRLYAEAAAETVAELESDAYWSDSIEVLLRHLDNHIEKVERLIAEMLPRRDQWLRHVVQTADTRVQREALENALGAVIETALQEVRARMPAAVVAQLPELARFAAENLFESAPASPVCACLALDGWPTCTIEELPAWQGLVEMLLTRDGNIRKQADKRLGFPPAPPKGANPSQTKAGYQERKAAFMALLASLEGDVELSESLQMLRGLPAPYYTESQWDLVEALFEILKLAVAHLRLVFQRRNQVDFTEIALRAKTALGDADDPTDLALFLDYRIAHILIDEFQDTSISQFELLRLLTAGWTPGDGRTFFGVGDPMQSIYSFREAEVGLFLNARDEGLGPHLPLDGLTLSANFRSDQGVVDWVNAAFVQVLPEKPDAATGAVPYTASSAVHPSGLHPAVTVHPVIDGDAGQAAGVVIACIREARRLDPDGRIAILVRSRPHLREIIAGLRAAGMRYKAVEIDSLGDRPVIGDLLALTRALSHPADRIAWLAVLRAPWCGMTLNDLFVLAGEDHKATLIERMGRTELLEKISEDGRLRLSRVFPVLEGAMAHRGRQSLRRRVESAWLKLGGPACIHGPADLEDAAVYLDFLEDEIGSGELTDFPAFEAAMGALFARPDPAADDSLQIMTVHKAKGLEFETVILPGLEKCPPAETARLLLWQERAGADQESELLLAPIAEAGTGEDPTYRYIRTLHDRKRHFEAGRLLYVAATRARRRLHLIGTAKTDAANNLRPPDRRSLLYSLWPVVSDRFSEAVEKSPAAENPDVPVADDSVRMPFIRRLPADWRPPELPEGLSASAAEPPAGETGAPGDLLRFDWAGETVRRIGTVIHRWLRVICETGFEKWHPDRVESAVPVIRSDLARFGVGEDAIADAAAQVTSALAGCLTDPKGRWILSPHKNGRCEYALSGQSDGRIISAVIDRTFVDERGTRWVIDYKSGIHRGGGLSEFLAQERARYEKQMALYARLVRAVDPRHPVRLALYFPRFSGWCDWADPAV